MKTYKYKVPGGKLVIVKITIRKKKIRQFQLLGDFFLYPEEKITLLEKSVISKEQQEIQKALEKVVRDEKIQLVGLSINDVAALIDTAFKENTNESTADN